MVKHGFGVPQTSQYREQLVTPHQLASLQRRAGHIEKVKIELDVTVKRVQFSADKNLQPGTEVAAALYLARPMFNTGSINGLAVYRRRSGG